MKDKKINTADMTRKIRDKFARRLAGKTHAGRIAFCQQQAVKMEKKIPTLLNDLKLEGDNQSKVYPAWPGNRDMETVADRIREKQSPYKKAK